MKLISKKALHTSNVKLHAVDVELVRKRIKNIYLRVCPPQGKVKISAPLEMPLSTIEDFVAAKQEWIKNQQHKVELQQRRLASLPAEDESCYFQGQLYKLRVLPARARAWQVNLVPLTQEIVVQLGGKLDVQQVVQQWYRCQLQAQLAPILVLWQDRLQVKCAQVQVRKMKTRWGSCTPATTKIRINLELVKRAPSCLEYVVVHELLHLVEPAHNRRFYALLDQHLPNWRQRRTKLRSFPLIG